LVTATANRRVSRASSAPISVRMSYPQLECREVSVTPRAPFAKRAIAAERSKKFDPAKLASVNFLLGARVAGIEPSHKSELNRNSSFLDQIHDSRCLRQIERNRLLGEYGFSGFCRNLACVFVGVTITTASTAGLSIAFSTSVTASSAFAIAFRVLRLPALNPRLRQP
jgi:hypothetical protein